MSADQGIAAMREFIDAFNAQDHVRLAASLNYPHIRLTDRFVRFECAEEFTAKSLAGRSRLAAEGWHHSKVSDVQVVQAGAEKTHLALRVHRCRADGTIYNSFETFWIATLQNGHWGIRFRSSFLG